MKLPFSYNQINHGILAGTNKRFDLQVGFTPTQWIFG
jgi:hypothetical protein